MPVSRRDFLRGAVALGAGYAILPRLAHAEAPENGVWLAGDLHCHTTYSGDVWSGPADDNTDTEEFYTLGWSAQEQIAIAESRLLDFLAITDHGDVRALTDPGYASITGRLTLIPGYEHSMRRGHAGCLGIDEVLSFDTSDDAGAIALRDAVRERGGLFILNHPFYDDGWGYSSAVRPDSIEVWNISWPYRQEIFGPIASTSENYKSLPYWEEFLAEGPMPANGGSDNHWRSTTALQGVGQPTTWVYAADRSWQAILDAVRAGRTTIAAEPPALGGPQLFLEARRGSDTFIVGDTVPVGETTVVARVLNAPGHRLQLVVDGVKLEPVLVTSPAFEYEVGMAPANRVRAQVFLDEGVDGVMPETIWMAALTSPIYFA